MEFQKQSNTWTQFAIKDRAADKEFLKGKIEIVNPDRIRVYFYKHSNILDVADEYHRTDDFVSFQTLLDQVRLGSGE
ncbi:MAG: hypothetical protein AAFO07_31480 [Bacteroidota bacterium]